LQSINNGGGILDGDDKLNHVADDKDQAIVSFVIQNLLFPTLNLIHLYCFQIVAIYDEENNITNVPKLNLNHPIATQNNPQIGSEGYSDHASSSPESIQTGGHFGDRSFKSFLNFGT
jgi:hypothetical protein